MGQSVGEESSSIRICKVLDEDEGGNTDGDWNGDDSVDIDDEEGGGGEAVESADNNTHVLCWILLLSAFSTQMRRVRVQCKRRFF